MKSTIMTIAFLSLSYFVLQLFVGLTCFSQHHESRIIICTGGLIVVKMTGGLKENLMLLITSKRHQHKNR